MGFIINPRRLRLKNLRRKLKFCFQYPFIRFGLWLGFKNIDYVETSGSLDRIRIGEGCSLMDAILNANSGTITIGDNTIFGYNVMLITGQHRFHNGKRAHLQQNAPFKEIPDDGNDIVIGSGCYIGSGVIVIKNVTVGDNVIIGAGAIVTKNIPSNCFAAGNPAKVIRYFDEQEQLTAK